MSVWRLLSECCGDGPSSLSSQPVTLRMDPARSTNATALADTSVDTRAFLSGLPRMIELATVAGTVLLCHGLGPNDMAKVGPDDFGYALETNDDLQNLLRNRYFRWVINGHSHRRMVRAFPGVTIINAGTLKGDHSPCFLEIDFDRGVVLVFEFADDGSVPSEPSSVELDDGVRRT